MSSHDTAAINTSTLQQQATERLDELLVLTYQHWPLLPTTVLGFKNGQWRKPRLAWYQRGLSAGLAYPAQCLIRLSLQLGLQNPQELLNDTLPHELAHIIATRLHFPQRIRPHGYKWQMVCELLAGHRLKRTHMMDVETLKARRTRYIRFMDGVTGKEHWVSARRVKRYGRHAFRSRDTGNKLIYKGEQQLR